VPADIPQESRAFVIGIASGLAQEVLQEQWHATKGTGRNDAARPREGAVEEWCDNRVEPAVQLFDPGDGNLDQLCWRHFALAHEIRLSARVELPKHVH
jgi:hypothetical protein